MTIKAIHGRQTYLCFHEISVYGDGTFIVSLVSLLRVLHGLDFHRGNPNGNELEVALYHGKGYKKELLGSHSTQ